MKVSDDIIMNKMNELIDKVDDLGDQVRDMSGELQDHKERHKMVIDVIMTFGKLIMGIATFFTIIGGAIFGFYKFIKGAP